jgi:hypothetical protein
MNLIPIILCNYGHFNLHPQLLSQLLIPINTPSFRTNDQLINLFNLYGNNIAQNCILRKENIPYEILKNKKIVINKDIYGKETLDVFEWDGDVVMKYW